MHLPRSCPHPHPPGPHSEFREPRRCTMRQHPLLAFATAVSTIAITLLGAVGSAGAATAGHRSARSTSTSRSTLAAGSALTLPITLAPPLTLASSTRHETQQARSQGGEAFQARDTRGRLDVKVSKEHREGLDRAASSSYRSAASGVSSEAASREATTAPTPATATTARTNSRFRLGAGSSSAVCRRARRRRSKTMLPSDSRSSTAGIPGRVARAHSV